MMKIENISDVITNSSSEVFLVKTEEKARIIEAKLKAIFEEGHPEDRCGGMGGIIECFDNTTEVTGEGWDWEDPFCMKGMDWKHKPFIHLPDEYVAIHIDECLKYIWKHIVETYDVQDFDKVNNKFLWEYWTEKEKAIQKVMENITSQKQIDKIWPEFEEVQEILQNLRDNYEIEDKKCN